MRILVTGGAGRLGIRVCKALLDRGYTVRIFDLDSVSSRKNLKSIKQRVEIYWGDITVSDSIEKALTNVDAIIHMAAVLTALIEAKPELAYNVNVGGTKTLVNLIKTKNLPVPLIYTSSVAVFGPTPDATEPIGVENTIPHPKGIYAETKLEAENIIKESGLDYTILRLGSFWQDLVFSKAELKYMFKIPLANRIETCHPDDLSTAIINTLNKFDTVKNSTFIISGGPKARILHKDRVNALMNLFGLPMPPDSKFNNTPSPMDWYDTAKSQNLLQFQTKVLSDSISDYKTILRNKYSCLFLPLMKYFIGPIFGKIIIKYV